MKDYTIYTSSKVDMNYPQAFIGNSFVDELIAKEILNKYGFTDIIKTNEYSGYIDEQINGVDISCKYKNINLFIDIKHRDKYTNTIPGNTIKLNKTNAIGVFNVENNKLILYIIGIGKLEPYLGNSINMDIIKEIAMFSFNATEYIDYFIKSWEAIRRSKQYKWNSKTDSQDKLNAIFDGIMQTSQLVKKMNMKFDLNPVIKII